MIRQAVALTPAAVDLTAVATSVADQEPALAAVVRREADFRAYRGDLGWWRQDWDTAETDLHRRSWLFSVLTAAHTPVVLVLAADIDVATSALTPKHYRSLEAAVTVFARSALKRQLSLREPLRLGRITYSARTLWLLRPLVTENSAEQVAKKFTAGFEDLLLPGMGDRRSVLRTIGAAKTVQIDTLRGTRDVLPVGAWAGDVKLGAMSRATATDILNHPDLWPVDMVGRAIRHTAREMSKMPAVASLAQSTGGSKAPDPAHTTAGGQPHSAHLGRASSRRRRRLRLSRARTNAC